MAKSKKLKYVAYVQRYEYGKKMGRPFRVMRGATKAEAKAKVEKSNKEWNARQPTVKVHEDKFAYVKKIGDKKKPMKHPVSYGLFGPMKWKI